MSILVTRARILIQQNRIKEAVDNLHQALSESPEETEIHYLLAECMLIKGDLKGAREYAEEFMRGEADNSFAHYLMSRIHEQEDDLDKALNVAREAIRRNPVEPEYYGLQAHLHLRLKNYQECLDSANEGLEHDPSNVTCLNMRSNALIKLKRSTEAFETMDHVLEHNPESSFSHATVAWNHLEKGDHKKALQHFREALRIDPNSQFAKAGMVEALKAKSPVYRAFLKYSFWMSNMKSNQQWLLILGGYFGARYLAGMAREYPELAPYIWPVVIVYGVIALSTWVISPVSDLFLYMNSYSRHALDRLERNIAPFTGLALVACALGLIGYAATRFAPWLGMAVFGFTMIIPLAIVRHQSEKNWQFAAITAGFLAGVGLLGLGQAWVNEEFGMLAFLYLAGIFGFQIISNIWSSRA
ncbi:MAG: tetratricopeptide repeat protein [Flavobacteriales bacterium]|nr:tetratricopeptide repeat protein [Flavobacteriales bacterium]